MADKTRLLIYAERLGVELQTIAQVLMRQRTEIPEILHGESQELIKRIERKR